MKTSLKIFVLLLLLASCEQKSPPKKRIMPVAKQQQLAVEKPKESGPVTIYSPPTVVTEATEKVTYHPHGDSVLGIWQTTKDSLHYGNDGGNVWVLGTYPGIFSYDGTYVTTGYLFVWRHYMPKWVPKDGYYKFKSKWNGDTLVYLTPHGNWQSAGFFSDGQFSRISMVNDSAYVVRFEKITRSEVPAYEKAILKQRKPHNYALK